MNSLIQLKKPTPVFFVALACFALFPRAQAAATATPTPTPTATVGPPPDGGYRNANTAEGSSALQSLTTGGFNTALGWDSLAGVTIGSYNTGVGAGTLIVNLADANTATGAGALLLNLTGPGNTANGTLALLHNTAGSGNTAIGSDALLNSTIGNSNTAIGRQALASNTTGSHNIALGQNAGQNLTTGDFNIDIGNTGVAGESETIRIGDSNHTNVFIGDFFSVNIDNTAVGQQALFSNTIGTDNTAVGQQALSSNQTGSSNTADGASALLNNTSGFNTALGFGAGANVVTANHVICIGAEVAGADVTNSCFIGQIRGVMTQNADAIPVLIDSAGQVGTMSSSKRFKKEIKPMDKASEAIMALKPVTFHYKSDKTNRPEFGLIAEEVAEVNPDLVVRDTNGEIYTVRYDAVNAMLLNEFLKEHRKVEELKKDFQATVAQLTTRLDEQASQIQKVSAQLEASKPAPQVVNNP